MTICPVTHFIRAGGIIPYDLPFFEIYVVQCSCRDILKQLASADRSSNGVVMEALFNIFLSSKYNLPNPLLMFYKSEGDKSVGSMSSEEKENSEKSYLTDLRELLNSKLGDTPTVEEMLEKVMDESYPSVFAEIWNSGKQDVSIYYYFVEYLACHVMRYGGQPLSFPYKYFECLITHYKKLTSIIDYFEDVISILDIESVEIVEDFLGKDEKNFTLIGVPDIIINNRCVIDLKTGKSNKVYWIKQLYLYGKLLCANGYEIEEVKIFSMADSRIYCAPYKRSFDSVVLTLPTGYN